MTSFLAGLPLFAGLSPADREQLEGRLPRREFPPQAVIVREGSAADAAFVVLSGRVAVRRKDPESGIEFLLAELGADQMFGEMAMLTKKARAASVVALGATTCALPRAVRSGGRDLPLLRAAGRRDALPRPRLPMPARAPA